MAAKTKEGLLVFAAALRGLWGQEGGLTKKRETERKETPCG